MRSSSLVWRGIRVGLLLEQSKSRVPELVPIRHGRMPVSAFTFYREAALPMAVPRVRIDPGPRPRAIRDRVAYLGGSDAFDQAIAEFAEPTPTRTNATTPRSRVPSMTAEPKRPPTSETEPGGPARTAEKEREARHGRACHRSGC
ncbi:DUF2252 family protein [Kribbella soli]|uniref:DUF2252 family protein n=1 Tax=Kribbella soli TaxID=1124743 RepID=UPI00192D208A|nr:DUF2252 family protein [Kribbella soli]